MAAPQTGLSILVDEKRVNDLLAQKSGAKAVIKNMCNTTLFICFLTLYTVLALGEPIAGHRAFEGYVRRRFDRNAALPLDQVRSIESFWHYVNVSFMPAAYSNDTAKYTYPGYQLQRFLPISEGNRLFGVGRLRQIKVLKNEGCVINEGFPAELRDAGCYGWYYEKSEDKQAFGPVSQSGEAQFMWGADPTGDRFRGKITSYPAGGFSEPITSNYNNTYHRMRLLEQSSWISQATRAIIFDFTVYNFNTGEYAVCTIGFEIAPSGGWTNTLNVEVLMQRHLNPLGFRSIEDWLNLIMEVALLLFVIRYLLEELGEFVSCEGNQPGKLGRPRINVGYFFDAWNLVDWFNLTLMIVTLGYRIDTWARAAQLQVYIGDPEEQSLTTFTNLTGVARNVLMIRALVAFNAVLTWFKAVKYIDIFPYIKIFMLSVSLSQRMLFAFVIVLFAVIIGFVLAFCTAFGETMITFRTPWNSMVFLIRSFLGDSDFYPVYNIAPLTGSLLIFLYVLAMVFVILNLFNSIMISALSDAKQAQDMKGRKEWERTVERAKAFYAAAYEQLQVEQRMRSIFPGLYSRSVAWRKAREKIELKRDEALALKNSAHKFDDFKKLGPGNPNLGRRRKRPASTTMVDDDHSSSDTSEDDLGPLRSRDQLTFPDELDDAFGNDANRFEGEGITGEPTPEAVQLVIEATGHVSSGIITRTRGARDMLLHEMNESKEILQGVGRVLEVLSRRSMDLVAQQRQLLKRF